MKNVKEDKITILLLCISPFFALISTTGSFSVRSITILIILLTINFLGKKQSIIYLDNAQKILLYLITVILFSTGINTIRHYDIVSSDNIIELLYFFAIYVWFYLCTNSNVSQKSMNIVLYCYHISSLIMSIQIITMSLMGAAGKIAITNFAGVLMDENYVTALISVTPIYLFIDLLYEKKKATVKVFDILIMLICSMAVALAGSRAALFAVILGMITTLFYYLKRKLSIKKVIFITVVLLVASIFIINLKNIMPTWIYNRYFNSNYMDHSNTTRLLIWENALHGIEDQPIIGFGMGTFPNISKYEYTAGKSTPAHQTILDMGLYGGIIGMLLFIWFILSIFFPIMKQKASEKYTGVLVAIAFVSMILSATKTVFLWNNLIYLKLILNFSSNLFEGNDKINEEN